MTKRLIARDSSVIIAADVPTIAAATLLAKATIGNEGISGFKLGIELGLNNLELCTKKIRHTVGNTVIIYDHQKAGNDIPEMGAKFAKKLKWCGVDAVILFPFTGPKTQATWTKACLGEGLHVIVGGIMTHSSFLRNEGGYISDDAPERIYALAVEQGIRDFVVPGTKINWVTKIRQQLELCLGKGGFDLYAPGFISQGGDITDCGKAAGPRFHAIIGSAIYGKERPATFEQMRATARQCTNRLTAVTAA